MACGPEEPVPGLQRPLPLGSSWSVTRCQKRPRKWSVTFSVVAKKSKHSKTSCVGHMEPSVGHHTELHLCLRPTCGPLGLLPARPGWAPGRVSPQAHPSPRERVQAPRLASEAQQGLRPGQPRARPHPDTGSTTLTISHGGRRGGKGMGLGNRHWFKSQSCHFALDGRKKKPKIKKPVFHRRDFPHYSPASPAPAGTPPPPPQLWAPPRCPLLPEARLEPWSGSGASSGLPHPSPDHSGLSPSGNGSVSHCHELWKGSRM